ncbi:MAG: Asp-tRNA(Asn)/Glu-tRNA(Gln) amidotransferase subunit GatB [Candidatus Liptonbacteria bacterium]
MSTKYQPTIGLEVHCILKTETKMFCDCPNEPEDKEPNKNTCPVCLGHPGTLPTINKKAVESVIRVGLALGGSISPVSKFDRKNYFYPDLPKGYQISQYDQPLVLGGELRGIRIRRIHLEEDAGRLLHEMPGQTKKGEATFVDFNRAGVPLMELVTEPDLRSGEDTVEFARELQRILRYLGVSDADMEKGHLRIEANVSLSQMVNGEWQMNNKVELKNINSFRAVGLGIAYELKRQEEILESGGVVAHETRGWDEAGQKTVSQRSKEEAHDYRYFPEPDLPPFDTELFSPEELRRSLPELPAQKRERFEKEFGLQSAQAALLTDNPELADYFEECISELATRDESTSSSVEKSGVILLFNYLTSDLAGLLVESGISIRRSKVKPEHLAHLVDLIVDGKIMSRQAKDILKKVFETGTDPEDIMKDEGLETVSDDFAIEMVVKEVIAENSQAVKDYKDGKEASMQFLVGKCMAKLKGRGNPAQLKDLLTKLI